MNNLLLRRRALMGMLVKSGEEEETFVDDGRIIARYNVSDISAETKLIHNGNSIIAMKVDGVQLESPVTTYQFDKTGIHEVKFSINFNTAYNISFQSCQDLVLLFMPNGWNYSAHSFASGCTSLERFYIPSTLRNMSGYFCNNCSSLKRLVIPEGVTSVPEAMVSGCNVLTYIELPSTITAIQNFALQSCNAAKTVIKAVTPPTIAEYVFRWNDTGVVYVPDESVNDYKAAQYWSDIASRIYPISQYTE